MRGEVALEPLDVATRLAVRADFLRHPSQGGSQPGGHLEVVVLGRGIGGCVRVEPGAIEQRIGAIGDAQRREHIALGMLDLECAQAVRARGQR